MVHPRPRTVFLEQLLERSQLFFRRRFFQRLVVRVSVFVAKLSRLSEHSLFFSLSLSRLSVFFIKQSNNNNCCQRRKSSLLKEFLLSSFQEKSDETDEKDQTNKRKKTKKGRRRDNYLHAVLKTHKRERAPQQQRREKHVVETRARRRIQHSPRRAHQRRDGDVSCLLDDLSLPITHKKRSSTLRK